jgi:flagellar protein FlbT
MALKISLKPDERIIIGGAVVQNGGARSDFVIENSVPVLREKDIMGLSDANSPCRRIYFAIQLMYVDERISRNTGRHTGSWSGMSLAPRRAPSV